MDIPQGSRNRRGSDALSQYEKVLKKLSDKPLKFRAHNFLLRL
jgi:hypothetical protein